MKHRQILAEIERCLRTIPGLRVERDSRQPDSDDDLRANGPIAILYSGRRETVEIDNGTALTWARRWQVKPVVLVLVSDPDPESQQETLDTIEAAFVDALDDSRLQEGDLLAHGSVPAFRTDIHNPDEEPLAGMQMFLNLTYDR